MTEPDTTTSSQEAGSESLSVQAPETPATGAPAWPPVVNPPTFPPPSPGTWSPGPPPGDGQESPWAALPPAGPTGRGVLAFLLALLVGVAVAAGLLFGHFALAPPSSTVPSAPGGPPNASAIAAAIDPALVDINVVDSDQDIQGAGTGMVLSSSGEVLTNNHVVEGETSISVTDVGNGKTYGATVLGYDRSEDIAVVQLVGASGLHAVTLGDSSTVAVGNGVVAIGNAEGVGGTPTYAAGSVTALDQSITAEDEITHSTEQLTGLIETNADIVPGDSGGPLVNASGRVIGMDSAAMASSFEFQGPSNEGFAIPINEADGIAKQIAAKQGSSTIHIGPTAFLGVEVEQPFGVSGAEIVGVVPNSPSAQVGLVPGDTITAFGGQSVASPGSLTDLMLATAPGASVQVQYLDASGVQHSVTVQLASGPPQ